MKGCFLCVILLSLVICLITQAEAQPTYPIVVNTWPFVDATKAAFAKLKDGNSAVNAVEVGCTVCEAEQCDGSVGFGGSPDEGGETTLDAMIMDGVTHDVGSVGCLKRIKSAISVARAVMEYTKHTLLVGEDATQFAIQMGFKEENLTTPKSRKMHEDWLAGNCQPNFWQNVFPNSSVSCGPYKPWFDEKLLVQRRPNQHVSDKNHDTIGMVAIDQSGNMACGTSTNGANNKIKGRVGDSPIAGAGAYVDNDVGGAAATGDGDVMMRFLPSFQTVQNMQMGMPPKQAAEDAIRRVLKFYPTFSGGIVALNKKGQHGGAAHGWASSFSYSVIFNNTLSVIKVPNISL